MGLALITCPCICNGTPLIAFQTAAASSGLPAERTSSHSAKDISFGCFVLTKSAACCAGVGGGGAAAIVNPAGGSGFALACASKSVQP